MADRGAPLDLRNLMLQPLAGACNAHTKDDLERQLSIMVCAGDLTLICLEPHRSPNLVERPHSITDKTDGITFRRFCRLLHEALPAGAVASPTAERARELRNELMELNQENGAPRHIARQALALPVQHALELCGGLYEIRI